MSRVFFNSKIHRALLTQADLGYEGSATIDEDLMDGAGVWNYEAVQHLEHHARGAVADLRRHGQRASGGTIAHAPCVVLVDARNRISRGNASEIPDSERRR